MHSKYVHLLIQIKTTNYKLIQKHLGFSRTLQRPPMPDFLICLLSGFEGILLDSNFFVRACYWIKIIHTYVTSTGISLGIGPLGLVVRIYLIIEKAGWRIGLSLYLKLCHFPEICCFISLSRGRLSVTVWHWNLTWIVVKDSVRTAQYRLHFGDKTHLLMLCRYKITVCSESHAKEFTLRQNL